MMDSLQVISRRGVIPTYANDGWIKQMNATIIIVESLFFLNCNIQDSLLIVFFFRKTRKAAKNLATHNSLRVNQLDAKFYS